MIPIESASTSDITRTIVLSDYRPAEGKGRHRSHVDVNDSSAKSFTTARTETYQLPTSSVAKTLLVPHLRRVQTRYKARIQGEVRLRARRSVNWRTRRYRDVVPTIIRRSTASRSMQWTMARKEPSLGMRCRDAWLSMAGNGDKGIPTVAGRLNGPSRLEAVVPWARLWNGGGDTTVSGGAVYSIVKYLE